MTYENKEAVKAKFQTLFNGTLNQIIQVADQLLKEDSISSRRIAYIIELYKPEDEQNKIEISCDLLSDGEIPR